MAKLEVRRQPPSGIYLIELAWAVGRLENLRALWAEWEDWFTDVEETHSSFPSLVFFRSTHPDQSWITAAGAILDGAALFASTVDTPRQPEPEFMIRSGYLCLRHLAEFFNIPVDHDPKPDDPISITRDEFEAAAERLRASGVPCGRTGMELEGLRRLARELRRGFGRAREALDGAARAVVLGPVRGRQLRAARPTVAPTVRDGDPRVECPLRARGLRAMTEATFVTSMGSFTARLMPEHAPKTVANFVELAQGSKEWTDPRDGSHATDPLYAGRSSTA